MEACHSLDRTSHARDTHHGLDRMSHAREIQPYLALNVDDGLDALSWMGPSTYHAPFAVSRTPFHEFQRVVQRKCEMVLFATLPHASQLSSIQEESLCSPGAVLMLWETELQRTM